MLTRLTSYEITDIRPEHPTVPGDRIDSAAGLFRASQRAIEIARTEQRAVAIWNYPECHHIRERAKQGRLAPTQADWVRFYSPGAPLVTADNWRTIAKLAALEAQVARAAYTETLAFSLKMAAKMATSVGFPEAAAAIASLRAEVELALPERLATAEVAMRGLDSRHWPRERREDPPSSAADLLTAA